jgi:hypothetical protein
MFAWGLFFGGQQGELKNPGVAIADPIAVLHVLVGFLYTGLALASFVP